MAGIKLTPKMIARIQANASKLVTSPVQAESIAERLAKLKGKTIGATIEQVKQLSIEEQERAAIDAQVAKDAAVTSMLLNSIPDLPTGETEVIPASNYTNIVYNERQNAFVTLASTGASAVLIGPAGTGKTTCMKGVVSQLIANNIAGVMPETDHPLLRKGSPGIVVCSFTRRAVSNIRKNMPAELKHNCMTIHKLLEFQPTSSVDYDGITGEGKTRSMFAPARHKNRPLPTCIHTIIVEEASMVGGTPNKADDYLLFNCLVDAIGHPVQFIFLGDIQQLPPVFGPAILGFKMLELPTIELVEVYRQALESPIIRLAHRILSGVPIPANEFKDWNFAGQLTLRAFSKKHNETLANRTLAAFFINEIEEGRYNVDEDVILMPFNKSVGTLELNKYIATHLRQKEGTPVFEIITNRETVYFAAGDKILIDREDAVITKIEKNPAYTGKTYRKESVTMNHSGYDSDGGEYANMEMSDEDIDKMLAAFADDKDEEFKRQASHIIHYKKAEFDTEFSTSASGDINGMLLAYAMTVHKSQGSEWRKVYCVFHHTHSMMLQREILYTAVTRAREELYVLCEADTFIKGIQKQKIPGTNWKQKAEYFKGKLASSAKLRLPSKRQEDEDE